VLVPSDLQEFPMIILMVLKTGLEAKLFLPPVLGLTLFLTGFGHFYQTGGSQLNWLHWLVRSSPFFKTMIILVGIRQA